MCLIYDGDCSSQCDCCHDEEVMSSYQQELQRQVPLLTHDGSLCSSQTETSFIVTAVGSYCLQRQ